MPRQAKKTDPTVRWMMSRELDHVLAIEQACFPYPWDGDDFRKVMAQRNATGRVIALSPSTRPIGFVVYEMHATRYHILSLAVHPDYWRQGMARAMVDSLKNDFGSGDRKRITLEVRERNLPAQLFWKAMGFEATATVRDFYDDTDEDAIMFEWRALEPFEIESDREEKS